MTSYMNIMVRVGSAKAMAQIEAMRAGMHGLYADTMRMNKAQVFGAGAFSNLIKFGSRLQWVGRQLQYNFTLPILLAAGAATKFAMDQEAAFVHVSKVYGSVSDAQKFFIKQSNGALSAQEAQTKAMEAQRHELAALDDAFTAISNHYGVTKKEVNEVAGAWAAAGASGKRLAVSVNDTMQAMIIGDLSAADATKSLISIQAQYNLNSQQLMQTLAMLNNVENQTGISMGGLIDGFTRAAGVARAAGVSTNELAAELAALVPATGTAANAGNALKTIYSRLLAPVKDSMDVMKAMGLQIDKTGWQSANAADRLHLMVGAFDKLSSAQKVVASSIIASRWQINKFEVLMDELGKKTGFYQKALNAASDAGNNFKVMQSELNTVLKSDPQSLKRMMVILQNASVKIIQPLIPFIIYLAQEIGNLAQKFADLDPHIQKLILLGLVFLALIGPIVRYLGALKILVGVVGVSVSYLAAAIGFLGKMFLVLPFRFVAAGFTMLFDFMMMLIPTSLVATTETMSIWKGLAAFFALWNRVVAQIFMLGNIAITKVWITEGLLRIGIMRAQFFTMLLNAKVFWIKFQMLWLAGMTTGIGKWAMFWRLLAHMTVTGLAVQFGWFRKLMGIYAIFTTLASAVITAWAGMWGTLAAITGAGWALIRAEWIVAGIGIAGIWTKIQTLLGGITVAGQAFISYATEIWSVTMGAIFVATRTYLAGLWAATWGTIRAISTLAALGEIGFFTKWWLMLKVVFMNGAVGLAWIMGGLWRGLTTLAMTGAVGIAKVTGIMWRGMIEIAAAGAASMELLFVRMRAALVVIWSTTAALSATIWKGMALTMVAFSRAGVTGMIGVFKALIPFMLRFGKFFLSWPAVIVAAIVGILYVFRNQIKEIILNTINYIKSAAPGVANIFSAIGQGIANVFNLLPESVQNAMIAVVNIVAAAAKAVYSWFQYLNPFAHHSPSLVENVTKGMDVVTQQFGRLGNIKGIIKSAYAEVAKFGRLTAGINMNAQVQDQKSTRKDLKKAGAGPAILGSYDRLTKMLNKLTPIADRLNAAMERQQRVVDRLQAKLDVYTAKLQKAQDALSYYASAPLKGMQAMNDRIERNTVAQNKLKLAMMNMEDAVGPLDDIKSKLDAINGAQEVLRGKRADLAAGGAGSDILKTYDDQIAALEKQKKGYVTNANALETMQNQLDALQRTADRLDLVKALKFDDLNYQIQKAADTTKELSFADIMNGVAQAQSQIAKYSPMVDRAQAKVDKQTAQLDRLTKKYNAVNDAIQAIQASLDNVANSASKVNAAIDKKKGAKGSTSPAMQAFNDAAKGNFPDVGGAGIGPRKNWNDQSAQIQKFTDRMANQTADMFSQLNPFKPLVDKAKAAWSNIKDYFKSHPLLAGMKNPITAIFGGVGGGDTMGKIKKQVGQIISFLSGVFAWFAKMGGKIWKLLGPDIKRIAGGIWNGLKKIWDKVGPELEQFKDLWKPLGKAIQNFWTLAKPFVGLFLIGFALLAKIVTHVVAEVIGPLLKDLGDIFVGVIRVVRGVFEVIIGIFSLNGDMIKKGFLDIFSGLGKIIWNLITGAAHLIWNAIEGLVEGVLGWFKWLWDELIGHSIIPDIVHGAIKLFKIWFAIPIMIWNKVIKPLWEHFKDGWNKIRDLLSKWWPWIRNALQPWYGWAKMLWDKVLVPLWSRVQDAFGKIKDIMSAAKERIGEIISGIKDKFGDFVQAIRDLPGKIRDVVGNMKDAGTALINGLWNGMRSAGTVIKDLAGEIWGGVRDKINSGIDIINQKIPDSIGKGPLKVDLPDNPFPHLELYTGGVVKGSRYGTPAMIGDKGYDEAVIPMSGPYAPRWARYQDQASFNPKSMSSNNGHTFIFNGDLSFPNIKSGDDVETLISNLENLAS